MMTAAAKSESKRYPELDALRALAVLLMVGYHLLFDLRYFFEWNVPIDTFAAEISAQSIASIFLLLVGIGFSISWNRTEPRLRWRKTLRRALTVLVAAAAVSLSTWLITPDVFIRFGILHLIGVSALFQPLFARLGIWNIALGSVLFLLSKWLQIEWPFSGVSALDYYPLLPWFGVILIGLGLGTFLYVPKPREVLKPLNRFRYPRWILWTGRRALVIYLLHQPLILLLISLFLGLPKP